MSETESHILGFGKFRVDPITRQLLDDDGTQIPLTSKVFDTLLFLVNNHGRIIEKDEIISAVWNDTIVEENNLSQNISALRRVLGEKHGENRFIVTVPGKGFKFVADVNINPDEKVPKTANIASPDRAQKVENSRFRYIFATAAIVIAVFASGYLYFNNQRQLDSIAVMPFVNESGDAELEYLSDGMTETLIGSLSKLPDLHVKARSSVFRYKGKNTDAPTIGKELNVRSVLYGRVVQHGEDLVLHIELVDAQTENSLWVETYNKKLSDLIALQGEVARDLVSKLSVKLSVADEQKLAKSYTENVEAYQLYQKGQFYFRKLTPPDIKKGIAYMQEAINADPSYALAYSGIAEAYRAMTLAGEMNPGEVFPKAKAAAQKAVEIDDELAEAHAALGWTIFFYDWNWREAENQFLRALELDPNSSTAHMGYSHLLIVMGRQEEALAQIKRAREIEPFSPFINAFEAAWLKFAKQPDAALDRVRIAIDLNPNFYYAHMIAAGIYNGKKMYSKSIAESRLAKALSPNQTWSDVYLADSLIETGMLDESSAILYEMLRLSESRFVPPYHIALLYNKFGETDQALTWLEKGYEQRDPKMVFLKIEPRWDNLRGDPRFQDIFHRVGF